MKIIHLSDTHLGAPDFRLHDIDPVQRLEACIRHINANHADADLCVMTGDLAHEGSPAGYAALKSILAEFDLPCRLMLGNHDDRQAFRAVFPGYPTDSGGFVQSFLETDEGIMIFLDTKSPSPGHHGQLCASRLDWLSDVLQGSGELPVFFCLHHPWFPVRLPALDRIALQEAEPLASLLQRHGRRIRHVFLGHVHRPMCGSWRGIPFSTINSLVRQIGLDFRREDGLPVSPEGPAYAVALIEAGQVCTHFCHFLA
ncbi:MAG: phosphodiesterase [Desulfocurvibacter africanus]